LSLETVIFIHHFSVAETAFPWSLKVLEVQPFDFPKIIDFVNKAESDLPWTLVKHFAHINETILEKLGWTKESPLLNSALYTETHQNEIHKQLQDMGDPTHLGRHPCEVFATSFSSRKHVPQYDFFLRQVANLAQIRIQALSTELQKKYQLNEFWSKQVQFLFLYTLTQSPNLFLHRHIDQLMICSFYITAKLNSLAIPFLVFVEEYMSQPQATRKVCVEVNIANDEVGDIIKFYNEVFLVHPKICECVQYIRPFITKAEEEEPHLAEATTKGDSRLPPPSFIVTPPVQQTSTPNPKGPAPTQNGPNQLQAFSPFQQRYPNETKRIGNLFLSPMKTPLSANRLRGTGSKQTVILNVTQSPQQIFKSINNSMAQPPPHSARKKLKFDELAMETDESEEVNTKKRKHETTEPEGDEELPEGDEEVEQPPAPAAPEEETEQPKKKKKTS